MFAYNLMKAIIIIDINMKTQNSHNRIEVEPGSVCCHAGATAITLLSYKSSTQILGTSLCLFIMFYFGFFRHFCRKLLRFNLCISNNKKTCGIFA